MSKNIRIYCMIIIGLLVLTAGYNIILRKENIRYKDHLTQEIGNLLRPMGSAINEADNILEIVIANRAIRKEQAEAIFQQYHTFAFNAQELESLSNNIREKYYRQNKYYFDLYYFFQHLNNELDENEIMVLDANELKEFEKKKRATHLYAEIFGETEFYTWNFSVSENKWLEVIQKITEIDPTID